MSMKIKKLIVLGAAVSMFTANTLGVSATGLKDIFDADYYAERYPDLKAAFGNDEAALYKHFLTYGIKEGRVMNPVIDIVKYREQYADLQTAFGDDWDSYIKHYFEYGINEKRDNGTDFDILAYIEAYNDIKEAFGNNYEAVAKHYEAYGRSEGRNNGLKNLISVGAASEDEESTETAVAESVGTKSARTETAVAESAGTKSDRTETAVAVSAGTESDRTESAGTESAGTETAGTESAGTDSDVSSSTSTASCDFTITGGTKDVDYKFEDGVLTILTATPITIKNTDSSAPTTNRVFVKKDIDANITLAGVNIVQTEENKAAFQIADSSSGNVTITLVNENILQSGTYCAGLQNSSAHGSLTITGDGVLTAKGGIDGAGIGGGVGGAGSNITISGGNVTAIGGDGGAGIGGGRNGNGENITIIEGTVTARGGIDGAGIGGGRNGNGSNNGNGNNITISGGNVTATSGDGALGISGAGIGGGLNGNGVGIYITGGTVHVMSNSMMVIGCGDRDVNPDVDAYNPMIAEVRIMGGEVYLNGMLYDSRYYYNY